MTFHLIRKTKTSFLCRGGFLILAGLFGSPKLFAFCGFFVGKADANLFNEASQVIIARQDEKTVLSLANDFKGNLKEFALVIPVPTVLQKDQVHVGSSRIFDQLDAFSAPRLVEYFDEDPCSPYKALPKSRSEFPKGESAPQSAGAAKKKSLGVTVEASFTVGEYDIVILSAKESDGLETWLKQEGYKVSQGIAKALKPYILQKMKFFVAKVNLKEQSKTGFSKLRPLQFAFESEKFMLPIRLGMANAAGPQDLIIYALTPNGRVESTNYRTVKLPTDRDLPVHIKNEFPRFYKDLFKTQQAKENHKVVFTEYFWDISWCDPCSTEPPTQAELKEAGVFWMDSEQGRGPSPSRPWTRPSPFSGNRGSGVKITRLHVRYEDAYFPEDLMFQETQDTTPYQGRYVLRHPWTGSPSQCSAAKGYFEDLRKRQETEATTLASLTGWPIAEIRGKMKLSGQPPKKENWWRTLWPPKTSK